MSGTLQYRLVVVDPNGATFTPGDTSIGDDHFWVTSRRRADHPWIESPPDGDGQKLDPVTGKTSDGDYRVRVIDEPETACIAWEATEVLDYAGLGLASDYLGAGGWTIDGTFPPGTYPNDTIHTWWGGTTPTFAGHVLFMWLDQDVTPYTLGPWTRSSWIQKTIGGLTPGQTYGLTFTLNWILDTGPGNIFVAILGTEISSLPIAATGATIWDITTLENDVTYRLRATATPGGFITILMGGENYAPSSNVQVDFEDVTLQEVNCVAVGSGGGARYVTQWLADTAARQRLLGRRAYVEQSLDNGASWTLLQAGHVTGVEMGASLVYEFSIGDTRRVERTRGAFRNLSPTTEPNFSRMTALVGGPVYGGFPPHSPRYNLPLYRIVEAQSASGLQGPNETPDGWVRLNYIAGPMPPGFRHPGTQHSANLVYNVLNSRAQPFHDTEASWSGARPSGAFPGLRATLFEQTDLSIWLDDLVPVGQNVSTIEWRSSPTPSGRIPIAINRGQEFTNAGLEIVLRWGLEVPFSTRVGDYFYVLITPREVSEEFPLYWRGHPIDFEVALLARHGIASDATTAATVRAQLGADLTVVMRFTDPAETVQTIVDRLHAFFGYATRVNDDGERTFFAFRRFVDTAPALSAVTNDLREEGGPTYRNDEDSRKNRIVVEQQFFRTISFDDEEIISNPDAIAVVPSTLTFDYSSDGGVTLDADTVGPQEVTYSLNGFIGWKADAAVIDDYEASIPMGQRQFGQGVARKLFAATGRGVQEATIVTRRDAADCDAARIGDAFALDADHVPNAQLANSPTSLRGGERWWRVIQRTEAPEGAELLLADANTGVAYGEVVECGVQPDVFDPGYFYTLRITGSTELYNDGAWCEVEVGLGAAPPTAGVSYTIIDGQEMVDADGVLIEPFPTRLGPFPHNVLVWMRARGFLVGGAPGAWSAWSSISGSVTNPGAGLSNLIIYPVLATEASLTWNNGDVTNNVRVEYRVNNVGAWTTFATLGPGSSVSTITGLTIGTLYGVKVVLWDGVAEVGSPLLGSFVTVAGELSNLVISSIASSSAVVNWGNTHPTFRVQLQYAVTGTGSFTLAGVFPARSIAARLSGLQPSTSYDVRLILLDGNSAEFGTALTDTFSTLGASGTLGPPTNPAAFAGTDPSNGGFARGLYGLRVFADLTNPQHMIVIEEAVETAIGSGTPGTYSEVDFLPAQYAGATIWTNTAPNDGKLRYLRALARLAGWADSASTTAVSIDPWGVAPPAPTPVYGSVLITAVAIPEDTDDVGDFLIAPGATLIRVDSTASRACRLRLYESDAARTADAARDIVQLPQPGTGVLLDVVLLAGGYAINLNPTVTIQDLSGNYNPTVTIYYRLFSYEPSTADTTVRIDYTLGGLTS